MIPNTNMHAYHMVRTAATVKDSFAPPNENHARTHARNRAGREKAAFATEKKDGPTRSRRSPQSIKTYAPHGSIQFICSALKV